VIIVFLDIDGVINIWRKPGKDPSGRFDQEALNNLKLILKAVPEALMVISSTWRFHYTLMELRGFFAEAGIDAERILDVTPDLRRTEGQIKHYPGKNEEIEAWLFQHPEVKRLAILDDVSMEDMVGFEDQFFQTRFEEGLKHYQSQRIIDHLRRIRSALSSDN